MPTVLETERLLLRTWSPDDAAALLTITGHPEVMRFIGHGTPDRTADDARQRIERRLAHQEKYGFNFWAVIEKATGRLVGVCGLKHLEDGPQVEVGYHFARDVWGRGYATEAARASLRHGFERLGLGRVVGVVHADNQASQRVLEKIGLVYEGMGHHYGGDCLVYAAARGDFR